MSNPLAATTFGNPDPSTIVTSFQELIDQLNLLVSTSILGSYAPYVISDTTPAVSDQDKVWFKTDGAGRPLDVRKFYNGSWRRVYSGMPNEVRMFSGDPSTFFDGTGLGLTTGEWDGWALMNGNNGTPNRSNLFVVGGAMDNVGITGYNLGWQSNVGGSAQQTGGEASHAITNVDLPNMTIQLSGKNVYDDAASHAGDEKAIVTAHYDNTSATKTIEIAEFGSDPSGSPTVAQTSVPTLPPFFVAAWVTFVGYA